MLMTLPHSEQKSIRMENSKQLLKVVSHRARSYDKMWEQSHRAGVGLVLGDIITGVASIGVPILSDAGRPFGAIGVSGPRQDFTKEGIVEVSQLMHAEARNIQRAHHELINSATL